MIDVFELDREGFISELEVRTSPEDVFNNAPDIYEYLESIFEQNCADSVLREWAFQWWAEKTGSEYDKIYNHWLRSEDEI